MRNAVDFPYIVNLDSSWSTENMNYIKRDWKQFEKIIGLSQLDQKIIQGDVFLTRGLI